MSLPKRWLKVFSSKRSKAAKQKKQAEEEFLRAAADGDIRAVRQLVKEGVHVACSDIDDNTALLLASQFHRNEVLRYLLEEHADKFDINAKDKAGNTPLIWTSEHGPVKMLDLLIEKNANVNDTDNNGQTALIRAASQEHVYFDSKLERDGDRSLHTDGPASPGSVVNFLIHAKADVNACNHDGYTALHVASFRGHPYVVKRLIQARANIDAKADKQQTPLLLASQRGQSSICDTLIKENCDVNAADERGQTPLMSSCCAAYTYIAERLLRSGADFNLRDNMHGYDAVFWAVEHRRKSIAQVLIKHGCNVNGRDFQGEPLLLKAAQKRSFEIVRLLIRHGADSSAIVHGKTIKELIDHPETREAMDRGEVDKLKLATRHARNESYTFSTNTGAQHISALSMSASTYNNAALLPEQQRKMSTSRSSRSRSSHQRLMHHRRPKLADIVAGGASTPVAEVGVSPLPPDQAADSAESSVADASAAMELHDPLSSAASASKREPLQTVGGLMNASRREAPRDAAGDAADMKEDANGRHYPSMLPFPADSSKSLPTPIGHPAVPRMPPTYRVQTDPAKPSNSSLTSRSRSSTPLAAGKRPPASTSAESNGGGLPGVWSTPTDPPVLHQQDSAGSAAGGGGPRGSVIGGSGQYKSSRLPRDVRHWKKRHVNMWLTHIELQEYSGNFADASVDGELLLMLLGDDGKELLEQELGVTRAFHKMKIIKEVRKLKDAMQQPPTASGSSALPPATAQPTPAASAAAATAMSVARASPATAATSKAPASAADYIYGELPTPSEASSTYSPDTNPTSSPTSNPSPLQNRHTYYAHMNGEESDLPPFRHIPFSDLTLEDEIGDGTFGTVFKATWRHSTVAVKMLHEQDIFRDQDLYQDFLREASLMEIVGHHSYIVRFSGACLVAPNLCLVFEYLPFGSAGDLIAKCRLYGRPVDLYTKVRMLCNAACGVIHLHAEGVIHRDLAARNLLVDSQLCGRVSDLGMSRLKLRAQRTGHTESRMGPVKWMSPEAIEHQQYSEASDAFSFGILIWEIMYEQEPYADRSNLEVVFKVTKEALTLRIESDCPPRLADLMRLCWDHNPSKRPNFEYINSELEGVLARLEPATAITAQEVATIMEKAERDEEKADSTVSATVASQISTLSAASASPKRSNSPARIHASARAGRPSPLNAARQHLGLGAAAPGLGAAAVRTSHDRPQHTSLHHSRGNSHRHQNSHSLPRTRPSSAHTAIASHRQSPHSHTASSRTNSTHQSLNGHVARKEVPPELLSILNSHHAATAAKLVDIEDITRSVGESPPPEGDVGRPASATSDAAPLNATKHPHVNEDVMAAPNSVGHLSPNIAVVGNNHIVSPV